ncbi:mechanosensitive ion channel protein 1, mitochondrial-like isoform X2 [Rhododendron vialii]|uniref:mechanosensitive ion channel protein 1, mitochondrial-like isoform X2 n=1 Tax=Rhododendron vialii TaxID=182163 RepID=UPI00265F5640|nr:mechanosensitive ion channel protein 1, mitochondrial-like isoform X2 [Rhododendron vialii]
MAAIRFTVLKSLCSSAKPSSRVQLRQPCGYYGNIGKFKDECDVRPTFTYINRSYHVKESGFTQSYVKSGFGTMGVASFARNDPYNRAKFFYRLSPISSNWHVLHNVSPLAISPVLNCRFHSSFSRGKGDKATDVPEVPVVSSGGEPTVSESGVGGDNWTDIVKDGWQCTVDAMVYTGERAKEASTELTPFVQQLLDSHPYLRHVILPVGCTLAAIIVAWAMIPRLLRRFHMYSTQHPAALLSGITLWRPAPYEKSCWGALEDPVRYLIAFVAFSHISTMIAPTTIALQYIAPAWRGAVIVSFVGFLHRWKTSTFARALAVRSIAAIEREKLLTLEKISSISLFVLGLMALAEAYGVAVKSVMVFALVGEAAAAFAARDILWNIFSGLSVQISQPFSVGDTIKVGSVEGQIEKMGLITTSLLSAEEFPIIVPNSLLSSKVIVNKSCWHALVTKIPVQTDDLGKIPQISEDIKSMLRSNSKVFMEKKPPFCFLSRIERSYAELTLGCSLKYMSKEEFYSTEQDILLQSVQIIKQHGATLGSTLEEK